MLEARSSVAAIEEITKVAVIAYIKAALTLSDARNFLFFPVLRRASGPRRTTLPACGNAARIATRRSRCRPGVPS